MTVNAVKQTGRESRGNTFFLAPPHPASLVCSKGGEEIQMKSDSTGAPSGDYVYCIGFINNVHKRERSTVLKQDATMKRYGWKPTRFFETEIEAWDFVVARAHAEIDKIHDTLGKARSRLAKCQAKRDLVFEVALAKVGA
jgi:hypothetical protein